MSEYGVLVEGPALYPPLDPADAPKPLGAEYPPVDGLPAARVKCGAGGRGQGAGVGEGKQRHTASLATQPAAGQHSLCTRRTAHSRLHERLYVTGSESPGTTRVRQEGGVKRCGTWWWWWWGGGGMPARPLHLQHLPIRPFQK